MDNATKTYIDILFVDFRANIIRFVQTEVKAILKERIHIIISENATEALQHINYKLNNDLAKIEDKINKSIWTYDKQIRKTKKSSKELQNLFKLIKELNVVLQLHEEEYDD